MICRFKTAFFTVVLLLLLAGRSVSAQKDGRPLVYPFGSLAPDSSVGWMSSVFDVRIGEEVKWVGLGEFTHGGQETAVFKSAMVRYLVDHRGYRQLLIEYPPMIISLLDRCLRDAAVFEPDSVRRFGRRLFGYSVLSMKPFLDLLVWIRSYNSAHPTDMVRVKGIDMEGGATAFADYFMYRYLLPLDHVSALGMLSKWSDGPKDSITVAELDWAEHHKERLLKLAGSEDTAELLYNMKVAQEGLAHAVLKRENVYRAGAYRDSVMAANVLALKGSKAMIWAHNIHLTTADHVIGLGNYLKPAAGRAYFCLLTDFSGTAKVWSISEKDNALQQKEYLADRGSFAAIIRRRYDIRDGVLFFDSLKAEADPGFNYIDRTGFQSMVPGKGHPFDALVIFSRVEPFLFD